MTLFESIKRKVKIQVNSQPFLHKFLVNRNLYRKYIDGVSIHLEAIHKMDIDWFISRIRDDNYPIDKFVWGNSLTSRGFIFWAKVNRQYNKLYEKYSSTNK